MRVDSRVGLEVVHQARAAPGPCAQRAPVVKLAGLAVVRQADDSLGQARSVVGGLFMKMLTDAGVPWNDSFDWKTFNYAPIAVGVVTLLVTIWWNVSAKNWFKGPIRNIDELPPDPREDPGAGPDPGPGPGGPEPQPAVT